MKSTSAFYFLSAFLSGLAVMAAEMSATRLLAPYFGNSLYVWTNVLGLVMLALAGGYFLGGYISDRHPKDSVYFLLILVSGVWILVLPFVAPGFLGLLASGFSNLASMVKVGSFLAVALLLIVPMFLWGMVLPYTVKLLVKDLEQVGRISGRVSMVSTFGSLLGTFLPAFVLIPILGTMNTFIVLGSLLCVLGLLGLLRPLWALLSLLSLTLLLWTPSVFAHPDMIASMDSPYGYIFVTQSRDGFRRLHVNNALGTQSIYDPNDLFGADRYYYSYFAVLPALVKEPKSVLILGHAGGTFTRIYNNYFPELEITGVELDPAMTEMAERFMGLEAAKVTLVHGDARGFLETTDQYYDVILVDTYHNSSIPSHLATTEFFALAESRLTEDGVLALNAASSESMFLNVLKNTFAERFVVSAAFLVPESFNTMIYGQNSSTLSWGEVPEGLVKKKEQVLAGSGILVFDSTGEIFMDDKSARVDQLTDEMFFQLLSQL